MADPLAADTTGAFDDGRAEQNPRRALAERAAASCVASPKTARALMSNETDRANCGLSWLLRVYYDGLAREPLPERWIELMRTLDEKQRLKLKTDLRMEVEGKQDPTRT